MKNSLLLFLLLLPTAYASRESNGGLSANANANDAGCAGLAGAHFVSERALERGRGPDGPVLGSWTLDFSAEAPGQVSWSLSDFGLHGTYSCAAPDGKILTSVALGDGQPVIAFYNANAGLLLWHGIWYLKR